MSRAAFLDRDGVINRKAPEGQYVTRWEEMHLLPGVAEAIALLNRAGFLVIVVSNQRCVAKGLITASDLESMHRRMCSALADAGATVDGVYYCPHEKQPTCKCRKPAPGMLLEAAREHQIDLTSSWMIGDSEIDVEAGRNAGAKTARVLSGSDSQEGSADIVASSLLEAIHQILKQEQIPVVGEGQSKESGQGLPHNGSKTAKSLDSSHDRAIYGRIVTALCAFSLCVLLVAGLSPFHAPNNDVKWLEHENGLSFGQYASAMTSGKFQANLTDNGSSCSIEIWVAPFGVDDTNTILSFDSSADPSEPFSVGQRRNDLVIKRLAVNQEGFTKKRIMEVDGIFRTGVRTFVTITGDGEKTSVYVNGVLTQVSSTFGLSPKDLTGQLVLADSTTHDNWPGQFLGMAAYYQQLTPAQVEEHYKNWRANHRIAVVPDEAPVALYTFNERTGSVAHNLANASPDLAIPSQYYVLHPRFLALPWREYYDGWEYWQDVGLNIVGFVPFGFALMAYFSTVRVHDRPGSTAIVLGLVTSVTIETLQGLLPTRHSGMTDILTNTLGTSAGLMLYRWPAVQALWAKIMNYTICFLESHSGKRTASVEVRSVVGV